MADLVTDPPVVFTAPAAKKPAMSQFIYEDPALMGVPSLMSRPPGAPSILQEVQLPVKLCLHQRQSPGDIVVLSATLRDLHLHYPGMFKTMVVTSANEFFEHVPWCTVFPPGEPDVHYVYCNYPLIHTSNGGAYHFIHGFARYLETRLGLAIPITRLRGHIQLSKEEESLPSPLSSLLPNNPPYWIIDAGGKADYTCKIWPFSRYQQVVDALPDITFVQIGLTTKDGGLQHTHHELKGPNVLDLRNKTSLRSLVRIMYHAAGVITPVSLPMHLAAAVPMHPRYVRTTRPCVVLAGGREPVHWEAYDNHVFLHTIGMLPCCDGGGCWSSRVRPLGDGDLKDVQGLCRRPVRLPTDEVVPMCLEMISVEQVVQAVRQYLREYRYEQPPYSFVPAVLAPDLVAERVFWNEKLLRKSSTNPVSTPPKAE